MLGSTMMISVSLIDADSSQPRADFDEAALIALGQNLSDHGQHLPIIVRKKGERYPLVDGERRWRAAKLADIPKLAAIVLDSEPTATELQVLRMSIDFHRAALNTVERTDLLTRIQSETNWSVTQLATQLSMSQPLVSKLLAVGKLSSEVRQMLNRGDIDLEKAFIITQEPDPQKQIALAKDSKSLTRDQLRARMKSPKQSGVKATSARFPMPGGVLVTVQGPSLTLSTCVEVFIETVKQIKKGQQSGHDICTLPRVMRNQCRQLPKSATSNGKDGEPNGRPS